ncbi:hypothetical protein N8198_10045 [Gammaproteobacteria bacterium]|nr:hypothetical protein [Gammaproteobacteria bacterium]
MDSLAIAPYINADTNLELDQMFASLNSKGLASIIAVRDANQAVADQHHVELITYEAGQHLVGGNAILANGDPRMADLYTQYQAIWDNKLLMHYHFTNSWGPHGSWGLKEYQMQNDAYKYNAVRDYINN